MIAPRDEAHGEAARNWLVSSGWQTEWLELGLEESEYALSGSLTDPVISTERGSFSSSTVREQRVFYFRIAVDAPPFVARRTPLNSFAIREWDAVFQSALASWERESEWPWLIGTAALQLQNRAGHLLRAASQYGAVVPPSYLSGGRVRPVLPTDPVVAKAINAWQEVAPQRYFNTRRVDSALMSKILSTGESSPLLLQHYVPHMVERRLYLVGRDAITVERIAATETVDFRVLDKRLAWASIVSTSDSSLKVARAVAADFGLSYCVFDFLVADDHVEYLTDINPAGSWHYLEKTFELGITKCIMTKAVQL